MPSPVFFFARVCVFFLSAVVSATWSNLVAYLWHSLAIVLMDVGVSQRAGKEELYEDRSGWRTVKKGKEK